MEAESALYKLREQRRAARDNAPPDTRDAILAATERVLESAALNDIKMTDIYEAAGVSRATFYSYFSSKFDAVAALHADVVAESYEIFQPLFDGVAGDEPEHTVTSILTAWTELWDRRRGIGRAIHEHWHNVPALGDRWLELLAQFTERIGTELDRQRERGLAPPGDDSRTLAASLLWTTENLFYVASVRADPNLSDKDTVLNTLITIWIRTLYPNHD